MLTRWLRVGLLVAGASAWSLSAAQSGGQKLLDDMAGVLSNAKSLSLEFRYMSLTGGRSDFVLSFSREALARVESPDKLIVSDGKTLTTYNKGDHTFIKQPASPANLLEAFSSQPLGVWAGFFDPGKLKGVQAATSAGTQAWKGVNLLVLKVQPGVKSDVQITYYLDPTDRLPRQIEFKNGSDVRILVADKIKLNETLTADKFAFEPPTGAREVRVEDLITDQWYGDLDAAMAAAAKTHRLVFLDLYADW